MTSYNKMRRYYFRMLDRFLEQCNVPKEVRTDYRREIHFGIKNELEVESIAKTKITDAHKGNPLSTSVINIS